MLDQDGHVRCVNTAGAGLVGVDVGDLLGKSLWAELPAAVGPVLRRHCGDALASQQEVECEAYFDLKRASFSIRIHPSPDGVTLVIRDRTDLIALTAERQTFLSRLLDAEDRERARIAADVHDDSVQALVVVGLRLQLLRAELSTASPKVEALLNSVAEQVTTSVTRLRALLFSLEPADAGAPISQSIRRHAAQIFDGSEVHWSVDDVDAGEELARAERSQALRIAKEALNNAQLHAHASEVIVSIRGTDEGVEIVVADDGVAVDPALFVSSPGHRGLATMRDRAQVAGGRCSMEASPGHGCTVRIFMPRVRTWRTR